MGHHGSDEMSPEMQAKLGELKKQLQAESPRFGATGKFPDGSLDKSDEGEIAFGVASHRGKVIINFGKPVAWLGMDATQAAGLAALLLKHASQCRDIGPEQKSEARAKEHN